ncbi:MAG TPA: hypothetical protein H9662_10110 [Firmicutes bacterium]|nr:hypothetical protein [Bacillota bacterium]
MPSTNKTEHYQLNSWIGLDKPQREDFNTDNQLIDTALDTIHTLAQTGVSTASSASGAISEHAADNSVHLSEEQKGKILESLKVTIGSYTGNGAQERMIPLSEHALFVLIFPTMESPVFLSSVGGTIIRFGICSDSGCSYGLSYDEEGFTVHQNTTANPTAKNPGLNDSNITYLYLAFYR